MFVDICYFMQVNLLTITVRLVKQPMKMYYYFCVFHFEFYKSRSTPLPLPYLWVRFIESIIKVIVCLFLLLLFLTVHANQLDNGKSSCLQMVELLSFVKWPLHGALSDREPRYITALYRHDRYWHTLHPHVIFLPRPVWTVQSTIPLI